MAKFCKCGHRKKDHDGGKGTCLVRIFFKYLPAEVKHLHSCAVFCQCTKFERADE